MDFKLVRGIYWDSQQGGVLPGRVPEARAGEALREVGFNQLGGWHGRRMVVVGA